MKYQKQGLYPIKSAESATIYDRIRGELTKQNPLWQRILSFGKNHTPSNPLLAMAQDWKKGLYSTAIIGPQWLQTHPNSLDKIPSSSVVHVDDASTGESLFPIDDLPPCGILTASTSQEAADFRWIAQGAAHVSRLPFLHLFCSTQKNNPFRKPSITQIEDYLHAHLPTTHRKEFLQAQSSPEKQNLLLNALSTPALVQDEMDRWSALTGRSYKIYDYVGDPNAHWIFVMSGSMLPSVESVLHELIADGLPLGLIKVRLLRPFSAIDFLECIPAKAKGIVVISSWNCEDTSPLYEEVDYALENCLSQRIACYPHLEKIVAAHFHPEHPPTAFDLLLQSLHELQKPHPHHGFIL